MKGTKQPQAMKDHLSRVSKGKHYSPATEFTSENTSGSKNNAARKVVQLDLDGNFIKEYPYIRAANIEVGLVRDSSDISAVCRGRQKTAGGYKWMYSEDYYSQLN